MKTLYIDIDGHPIVDQHDVSLSRKWRLEVEIRSGFASWFASATSLGLPACYERAALSTMNWRPFSICRGAFCDQIWLRSVASLVAPEHWTREHRCSGDWWYVDDLAAEYLHAANQEDLLKHMMELASSYESDRERARRNRLAGQGGLTRLGAPRMRRRAAHLHVSFEIHQVNENWNAAPHVIGHSGKMAGVNWLLTVARERHIDASCSLATDWAVRMGSTHRRRRTTRRNR